MAFVTDLNSRLKTVLFVNNETTIYEQFMSLCFILTNKFSDRGMLLNKIQEYIITYKLSFRLSAYIVSCCVLPTRNKCFSVKINEINENKCSSRET